MRSAQLQRTRHPHDCLLQFSLIVLGEAHAQVGLLPIEHIEAQPAIESNTLLLAAGHPFGDIDPIVSA